MPSAPTVLDRILVDVREEIAAAKQARPLDELQRRLADAPPPRSLPPALRQEFGLIAEIKKRSPSRGAMPSQDLEGALRLYDQSPVVRAVSVLTNRTHFGMDVAWLTRARELTTKPILRKEFILEEYQLYEARVFGADAVLLMAEVLPVERLHALYRAARDLGLDVLLECHTRAQVAACPPGAEIIGLNSRIFKAPSHSLLGSIRYGVSRLLGKTGRDFTVDRTIFELGSLVPATALKVAESGIKPATVRELRDRHGFAAALVGTYLLSAACGPAEALRRFESALA